MEFMTKNGKTISREELIERSHVVRPNNIVKDRNNCLGDWKEIFEAEKQRRGRLNE